MRRLSGYALLATAFVACPCHLLLVLPLFLTMLSGTALGTFLATRTEFVFAAALVYFLVALVAAYALLHRRSGHSLTSGQSLSCSVREKEGALR